MEETSGTDRIGQILEVLGREDLPRLIGVGHDLVGGHLEGVFRLHEVLVARAADRDRHAIRRGPAGNPGSHALGDITAGTAAQLVELAHQAASPK